MMLRQFSFLIIFLVKQANAFAPVVAEARKQVMEATERLGGQYSSNLHPQCTHLVVQISFNIVF
jgi:hypothetical protein